jgi:hypothetical protein
MSGTVDKSLYDSVFEQWQLAEEHVGRLITERDALARELADAKRIMAEMYRRLA